MGVFLRLYQLSLGPLCLPHARGGVSDISEADAQAEGITFTDYGLSQFRTQKPGWFWRKSSSSDECLSSAYWAFCNLWANVYGEESWRSNPWVWVIEFKRVEGGAA